MLIMAAVIFTSGCATKRDVMRVEEQVVAVKHEQRELQQTVRQIDSLLNAETAENAQLRAEFRTTLNDMVQQFQIIQANMNDLLDRMNTLTPRGPQIIVQQAKPDTSTAGQTPGDTTQQATVPETESTVPGINCQKMYDDAFVNIVRGQYEEAITGFDKFLESCRKTDLADDAIYWKGEGYYSMGKYREAIAEFDTLNKEFSGSEKRPGALYKMARSREELGQKDQAKQLFQQLVDEYPGTLEGEQAKNKLKEL